MKDAFKDPNHKAALTPYHPNAIRNRLKVEFKDSAIPSVRFCHPRNEITYECAAGPAGTCGQGTFASRRRVLSDLHALGSRPTDNLWSQFL